MLTAALVVWLAAGPPDLQAGAVPDYRLPDLVPYVEEDAPSDLVTLQDWQISGNEIRIGTLFSNQGDGVFEIRKGVEINPDVNQMLQRVYIDNDYTSGGPNTFEDIDVGTSPAPGSPTSPDPLDFNVIWFENFSRFSLHEAPVVDGVLTVGSEVAGDTKTSWRLFPNRGPLPGYGGFASHGSLDPDQFQRIGVGWADLYTASTTGQFVDITGVPTGPLYWLRQTIDPTNRILETDETNNSYEVLIDLANPGYAFRYGGEYGSFLQAGDAPPIVQGDLTGDALVTPADWNAFKAASETPLGGLSEADAYALGDLNLDGRHSLADAALFRRYYDEANGAGAFAAINTSVPEPAAIFLIAVAAVVVGYVGRRKLYRARRVAMVGLTIVCFLVASTPGDVLADITLWTEDFESVTLGPNIDETLADPTAWTDTPPAGWTVDDTGVPGVGDPANGVTEWEGWSFADKSWWGNVEPASNGQGRKTFTLGQGVVAVAETDEWGDLGDPASLGTYNAFMTSPVIDVSTAAADSLRLDFSSSWRAIGTQTAVITVRYDGGAEQEVLRWESSDPINNPFYKPSATSQAVQLDLSNPAASTVQFEFGLVDAGEDWWWAIDNLKLAIETPPPTLQVNTTTGELTILNAYDVTGYEVLGPPGSLDEVSWRDTNLDARNVGSSVTADFNNDHVVGTADYTKWRDNQGGTAADADGDGMTGPSDYLEWKAQFGDQIAVGDSWETVAGSDERLSEFFLFGQALDAALSIGNGYDTVADLGNLQFFYSTPFDLEIEASVIYTGGAAVAAAVPEPGGMWLLAMLAAMAGCVRGRAR